MANNEKSVEKITLTYDDGTQREISKGFIGAVSRNELEGTDTLTFNLVHISSEEVETLILGIMEFARKIGMFGDLEDMEDE